MSIGPRERALNWFVAILRGATRVVGGRRADRIAAGIAERMPPIVDAVTPAGTIRFFCPGLLPERRAVELLTKEPETIAWIDGFSPGDVFWDIGANVGSYSLYAALRGVRTVAFEPAASNYFLLNRNIEINRMGDRISAYCVALSDVTRLAELHMQTTELGGAFNSFSEALDWQGRPYTAAFNQGMVGFDIDSFVGNFRPAFPTHIKIDVDGLEHRVLAGARETLADRRLRSVLIEIDGEREAYKAEIQSLMERSGLDLAQSGSSLTLVKDRSYDYLYLFRRR